MSYTAGSADAIDRVRAEIGANLARIVGDTKNKIEDPDRFDRTYVLEDFVARVEEIAASLAGDDEFVPEARYAYEIGEADDVHDDLTEDEDTGPIETRAVGRFPMPDGRSEQ